MVLFTHCVMYYAVSKFWADRLQRNSCCTCSIQSGISWINYVWRKK